jgi:histidyl-tRNA synthetase
MIDYLCDDCRDAFDELKANLTASDIAFAVDPSIVRGLDYYTKTAFEFVTDRIGAQGTVCGGGRYDRLIEELGGPPVPGVGFGLGIERLLLLMDDCGAAFPAQQKTDALIVFVGGDAKDEAMRLMRALRDMGLSVEMDLLGRSVKNQFKYADRIGARCAVVLGEEELRIGKATVKDMKTGEQQSVDFENVGVVLRR